MRSKPGTAPLGALRLPQVKFMQPLLPGETARVVLEGEPPRWRFQVLRDEVLLASGEVLSVEAMSTQRPAHERELEAASRGRRLVRDLADPHHRPLWWPCDRPPVPVSDHRVLRVDARTGAARLARITCNACSAAASACSRSRAISIPSPRPSSTACSCCGGQFRHFDVDIGDVELMHAQLDRGGVLLFGSHLGSFEVLRVLARRRPQMKVRVLLDKGHNPAMTQLLDALNPEVAATVIDAGQDGPSIVLEIQQALAEGALVALLVDRAHPGEATLPATFLGEQRALPDRAVADRRGAEGAGGARLRPVPRRQPL